MLFSDLWQVVDLCRFQTCGRSVVYVVFRLAVGRWFTSFSDLRQVGGLRRFQTCGRSVDYVVFRLAVGKRTETTTLPEVRKRRKSPTCRKSESDETHRPATSLKTT
jgi:hypothetical protein